MLTSLRAERNRIAFIGDEDGARIFIGASRTGQHLEIGLRYAGKAAPYIFHADELRPGWRKYLRSEG